MGLMPISLTPSWLSLRLKPSSQHSRQSGLHVYDVLFQRLSATGIPSALRESLSPCLEYLLHNNRIKDIAFSYTVSTIILALQI